MKLSTLILEKAKAAKSSDELLAMAKENNIEMTEEQAITAFTKLNGVQLTDEQLEKTSGGGIFDIMVRCMQCGKWFDDDICLAEHMKEKHPQVKF